MLRRLSWLRRKPFIKELTKKKISAYGRSRGKLVVRHRSAGQYKTWHFLDRKRLIWNLPGQIISFEKSAIQRCYLALLAYPLGILVYVIASAGQTIGDRTLNGWDVPCTPGNSSPLLNIPLNVKIHSLESYPGSGSIFVRSPGNWAKIVAKNDLLAKVVFRNGTEKFFDLSCMATIGRISNIHQRLHKLTKAGQSRSLGRRPSVRGVAKNPVDHPHGGGKGKKSKNSVPEAPWGRLGARKKRNVKKFF